MWAERGVVKLCKLKYKYDNNNVYNSYIGS